MRINQAKIPVPNLMGEVQLTECPSMFRLQAENILVLLGKIPPFEYHSMGQFDMRLTAEYWRYFDGIESQVLSHTGQVNSWGVFLDWMGKYATYPEYIRRARQWLVEKEFLIPALPTKEKAQARAGATREEMGK